MILKNTANLGDNLLQLNFMRRACRKDRSLTFDYFCKSEYHTALSDFINNQILLLPLEVAPPDTLDTWIAAPCHGGFYHRHPLQREYPQFYLAFFTMLARRLGIDNPIRTVGDVMLQASCFESWPDRSFVDVLVIDCPAKSGQFNFVPEQWSDAVARLRAKGLLVATVNGMGRTLKEIGQLAVNAKHVWAVGTGPLHAAFNTVAAQRVESWHIFDHCHDYCYNDRVVMHHSGLDLESISLSRY